MAGVIGQGVFSGSLIREIRPYVSGLHGAVCLISSPGRGRPSVAGLGFRDVAMGLGGISGLYPMRILAGNGPGEALAHFASSHRRSGLSPNAINATEVASTASRLAAVGFVRLANFRS